MGIISKVLESNSYEITKDSNSAIVKAQKRVFTRVDAAIFCAAISGRKREEWQRALETGRRSAVAVHRSPKFPPNYRRARFKRTLIGLAAVERGEISRGERRSLLPLSLSLSFTPFARWSSVNENLNLSEGEERETGSIRTETGGKEGRWIVKKTTSWRSDLWVKGEDSFFPFFFVPRYRALHASW